MFVGESYQWHTMNGQRAQGTFLLIVQDRDAKETTSELRGIVRFCRMAQLGHWMMGDVSLKGRKFPVSGTYGGDGLPVDVDAEIFAMATPLPEDLQKAFWAGGGHNTSGSEGPSIAKWAAENLVKVRVRH